MAILTLNNICKKFGDRIIFNNFSLSIEQGEYVSITGGSGKGKTTLLNIIGLLEKPDSGDLIVHGIKNPTLNSRIGIGLLKHDISYVFQNYGLVENKTVLYNLKIAAAFLKCSRKQKMQKISEALQKVGLVGYENKKVYQLSGGEQQRVALAKVIIKPTTLLLTDEPTGSLDVDNRNKVLEIFDYFNSLGITIIIVTHDPYVCTRATRNIKL